MSWPHFVSVEEPEQERDLQTQICQTYGCTNLALIYFVHCSEHLADLECLGMATDWKGEISAYLYAVDWECRS
jgi:hypothetical protein